MTSAERTDAYLAISATYGGTLGGLVWSYDCDAIERWNGTTFAFAAEIRDVLEGVFAKPPIPPFEFVLTLLRAMRDGPERSSVTLDRLWRVNTGAKGSTNVLRNTGLLISELCRTLPPTANLPRWEDLSSVIGSRRSVTDWSIPEVPTLPRDEFERRIEAILEKFDDERLLHWFKNGCDPLGVGERLAEPLESLPVRVSKLIALARLSPRLVGSATLVATLDSAITLPPRRRSPNAIPQGGYCDVTTRGEPERLLPGQFALDRDEFVRRFAENELLYFQREEPQTAPKPQRLIVLDQGVRTWGSVRLALAAAALVLMKKDAKRVGSVRLAATSTAGTIDVQEGDPADITKLLEASDLTPNPGPCVLTALNESIAEGPRDVILLTHPRALREHSIVEAIRSRLDEDRIFALSVDERGQAELHDWTENGPVSVRRFRVDLAAAESATVAERPISRSISYETGGWTGDVEPVGFPFRPGLVAEPTLLGFDADGEWLVVACLDGVLHGLALDGGAAEVLPRPYRDGVVLKRVEALLGVASGVVVCGRMAFPADRSTLSTTVENPGVRVLDSSATWIDHFVAAHFDRRTRRVTLHILGPANGVAKWSVFPELNCVVVTPQGADASGGCALDLSSSECYPKDSGSHRARTAMSEVVNSHGSPPHLLDVITNWNKSVQRGAEPFLALKGNSFMVGMPDRKDDTLELFEPMRDGKPLLAGTTIHQALYAHDTLALTLKKTGERLLIVIDDVHNRILGEVKLSSAQALIALAPEGHTIAFVRPFRTLVAARTNDVGSPRAEVKPAALHNSLAVRLHFRKFRLFIRIGSFEHIFTTLNGELVHTLEADHASTQTSARAGNAQSPSTLYDFSRFPPREIVPATGWRAVLDRLGQVLLYRDNGTLVASFLIRRERAAAWIPGGVFWGDPVLIGAPASPDAAKKIGAVIAAEASP